VMGLGSLQAKFEAFGFDVRSVDGHDERALDTALGELKAQRNARPKAIVARTVKGKGVSFMENENKWHYTRLTEATYLAAIPPARVAQVHLAGHTDEGTHLLDTHIGPVPATVWALYRAAVLHCGPVSTLVEWDEEVPDYDVLVAQAERARALEAEVLGQNARSA